MRNQVVNKTADARGASMVEFAIFLPFLIVLFFGLVEMGRLLSEYTWVAQATYQTAMLGSETSFAIGVNAMQKRVEQLDNLQGQRLDGALGFTQPPVYETDSDKRFVRVSVNGQLGRLLSTSYGMNLNVSMVAPILLAESDLPDDLSTPSDSDCKYTCDGTVLCCGAACAGVVTASGCAFAPKPNDPGSELGGGGGGWEPSCFVADTAVLMADGSYKAIQEIKPGDRVASYNPHNGEIEANLVTTLYTHESKKHLLVNEELRVTGNHPMLHDGRWVHMAALKRGSTLTSKNGKKVRIKSVERVHSASKVYNLEVVPNHTYIVSGDNLIVHNAGTIKIVK